MRRSGLLVLGALVIAACTTIAPRPLTRAPMNSCEVSPCDRYEPGAAGAARCGSAGRCEILSGGGRPNYPFWIVVHVPETSIFAPGLTYVMFADEQRGAPAFVRQGSTFCSPPQCLLLDRLTSAQGQYLVSREAWKEVHGWELPADSGATVSIPVRVVYEPVGNSQRDPFAKSLPLDVLFDSSRFVDNAGTQILRHGRAIPAGNYVRTMYPQAPYDGIFPPTRDLQSISQPQFVDTFTLLATTEGPPTGGQKLLDDPAPREAIVRREEGLDGWRVWLVDSTTQQRISVVRSLSGKEATVRLHTTGETTAQGGGLNDNVEAVVAPPETWTAVPRYVSLLFLGAGLKNLNYPAIPPPVTVTGVVAQPGDPGASLLGYAARIRFASDKLAGRVVDEEPLLQYSAEVATDDSGRFTTVLPPGSYFATIEPAEGTGYATSRQRIVVERSATALTLRPPLRTLVKGKVLITDGRPLAEAELLAIPDEDAAAGATSTPRPRPARARVNEDGTYAMELDPGPYVLTVTPKNGTGFPRVALRAEIPAAATELPDIRVPAPTRLAFTLRDSSPTANPIERAIVRIFAVPQGSGADSVAVEVGSAMTDAQGAVEILLAQRPR